MRCKPPSKPSSGTSNGNIIYITASSEDHTNITSPQVITEIFGPDWRCPSPVILHIGDAPRSSTPTTANALCPIWKRSNQLFGKVFNYRPGTAALNADLIEAGLLYLGIKQGWDSFNEWSQSPALKILKEVDEFLFYNLPRMERLAAAYKSFKLLKVSLLSLIFIYISCRGC